MTNHLLPKYLASESKHLRLLENEAGPVQWPGSGGNHAALVKHGEGEYPYWFMDVTLCGIPVPQFDPAGKLKNQPICAGDVDCPACLEALNL